MVTLRNRQGDIIKTPYHQSKTINSEPLLSRCTDMAEMKRVIKRPTGDIDVCLGAAKSLFEYLDGLGGVDKVEDAFQLLGQHFKFKLLNQGEKPRE